MDLQTVISRLEGASAPARGLDALIAEVIGWRRREQVSTDPKTGETRIRTLWLVPAGDDFGRIPLYTVNLQDAFELAHAIRPGHTGGCSWMGATATAVIGNGKYAQAATPAIALCVAALRSLSEDAPE
ncbi:hypothetical protein D9M68_505320 [compost metagenome]